MNPEMTHNAPQPAPNHNQYRVATLGELLEMDIPPREWLLYPFLQERSTCMLYAKRGVGKTYVGLSIALAVAGGVNIMDFNADTAHKVLYIDGEMSAYDLRERARGLALGLGDSFGGFDNLQFLSAELQPNGAPNLAHPETQREIEALLDGVDLIIIDNLSALCSFGRENEAESWGPMQRWLLHLKHQGKSVLVIDHAGKNGDNRGTSKKQDALESVINLEQPEGYKTSEGARFIITYTKSRGVHGEDIEQCEARLREGDVPDSLTWDICGYISPKEQRSEAERARARELKAAGKTSREIAQIMGIGKTKAAALVRDAPMPAIPVS